MNTRFSNTILGFVAMLLAPGCATTTAPSDQTLDATPTAHVDDSVLNLVRPRPTAELLADARGAFEGANAAHEKGDLEASLRQYNHMLDLLIEAELPPSVFYNLGEEFQRILAATSDGTTAVARAMPRDFDIEAREFRPMSDLDIPDPINERIVAEIEAIQRTYPKNFQEGLDRSYKYLPYIQAEFDEIGLPRDLAWLAMVESQFTPKINSRVGAGGMWQFMRPTGQRYGLTVTNEIDDRYDWKKETKAAAQYLKFLYEMFDENWPLAVSAYNMGENGVERAIAASGGETDLWRLLETPGGARRIPRETKKFYAKLVASIIVAKNPEHYGFEQRPQAPESTVTLNVKGPYSLRELEAEAGLLRNTLAALNPQYVRGNTPRSGGNVLYVPTPSRSKMASALRKVKPLRERSHVVVSGQTPSQIAKLHGISTRALMEANNIRSARHLQIGQRLVLPGVDQPSGDRTRTQRAASSQGRRGTHTVRSGDSLSRIASRNGVTVSNLQQWNDLGRRDGIHVGDTLYVAPARTVVATARPSGKAAIHCVQEGEFPGMIASRYRVKLADFLAWNGLSNSSTIHVGDELKVYGGGAAVASAEHSSSAGGDKTPSGERVEHVVVSGENPSSIAKRYGVKVEELFGWNGWTQPPVLHIGDKLTIYTD
ncbi:MAG: LysM peptidoglycan-binding domain-containing protein [Candidatus Hydrogenedentes bacterium]|nr:LysM peptidoglycan-binding domain-containing protein [Candidatus Hydrogenedentota bacterium]